MLAVSRVNWRATAADIRRYHTKLRQKYRNRAVLPIRQHQAQRDQTIRDILAQRKINDRGNDDAYHLVEKKLYSRPARLEREGLNINTVYALQGLGDLEPLRSSRNFGLSERAALKYDSPAEVAKYEPPPEPYSGLMSRKLAEGKLWPQAPTPSGMMSLEVRHLRNPVNMSPSARAYCERVIYHLRRSLKACPAHIAERIDFAQLIIQEVLASRRSREMYIVWSTVEPSARFEIEPLLHRMNHWVQLLIIRRIKTRPNIPHIHWIYDGDRIERQLPYELTNEIKSLAGEATTSLETRVQYLKELDTVNQRMQNIPWFMPYLWNKEEKADRVRRMRSDLQEYENRRRADKKAQQEREQTHTRRAFPAQTAPPPSYMR